LPSGDNAWTFTVFPLPNSSLTSCTCAAFLLNKIWMLFESTKKTEGDLLFMLVRGKLSPSLLKDISK
jgi:hypothetical protein